MKFNVNSSLSYIVNSPTTFIFNIHALNTLSQKVLEENLVIEPTINHDIFTAHDGSSKFMRLKIQETCNFSISYSAVVDMNYTIIDESNSENLVSVVELDSYIASFLYPSRYCQSDKLMKFSFKEFGHYTSVYDKVLAITDWIYNNIE